MMRIDREFEDEDKVMLEKLLNVLEPKATITFDNLVDALYAAWRVNCEPESHIDFADFWARLTVESKNEDVK